VAAVNVAAVNVGNDVGQAHRAVVRRRYFAGLPERPALIDAGGSSAERSGPVSSSAL
jgi:hypothetical protein